MPLVIDRRGFLHTGSAALASLTFPRPARALPARGFTHGVASGEPRQTSVALWTRFVSPSGGEQLRVEVAEDRRFRRIAARGEARSRADRDHSAKVVASGLRPGRRYFYRFIAPTGEISPAGRTATLPAGRTDAFRIAVFSCSNATSGWFNAYAHAAARDDIDLVLHLGDYIYESPLDRRDAVPGLAEARRLEPRHEAVTLADYRARHASYRTDPDLRALHQAFPMIAVPDDHETANNAWKNGAGGHGTAEGSWDVRKLAGMRAYHEWLPVSALPYDEYQIGDLATLFRLETRLLGRDRQLDIEPVLSGGRERAAALQAFRTEALNDPSRTMMGRPQEEWLHGALRRSTRSGTAWQVLAQQVVMGPLLLPRGMSGWLADPQAHDPDLLRELEAGGALGDAGLPARFDRWDGYPQARDRLLAAAQAAGANLVTLSGDSHNAWAYDLSRGGRPAGVEFAGQSVSSFGLERRFDGDPARIAADLIARNPSLKWCDTSRRGYMVIDLRPDRVACEWVFVSAAAAGAAQLLGTRSLAAERGANRLAELA